MKQQKSRKGMRILKKRTPKGRNVTHYEKQRPDAAICARCTCILAGVPRDLPSKVRKMTRSQRTVTRKFGGVLCANCVKELLKYQTRLESGFAVKRDLTLEKFLPAGWYGSLGVKATTGRAAVIKPKVEEGVDSEKKPVEPAVKEPAKKAKTSEKAEKKEKKEKASKEEKKTKKAKK